MFPCTSSSTNKYRVQANGTNEVGDLVFTHTGELKPVVYKETLQTSSLTTIKASTTITSTEDHKHLALKKGLQVL